MAAAKRARGDYAGQGIGDRDLHFRIEQARIAIADDPLQALNEGVILVRRKPGAAKRVLFITIEDKTGIASGPSRLTVSAPSAAPSSRRR